MAFDVMEGDVRDFSAKEFKGVDLLAGGVPCPPFSKAGKQLGSNDERNLFPGAKNHLTNTRQYFCELIST